MVQRHLQCIACTWRGLAGQIRDRDAEGCRQSPQECHARLAFARLDLGQVRHRAPGSVGNLLQREATQATEVTQPSSCGHLLFGKFSHRGHVSKKYGNYTDFRRANWFR